jgi:Glyoxalase-like domain
MTVPWTLTFDCHDAPAQAEFWKLALGYVDAPPPEGWTTWESWLRDLEVPEDEWDDGAVISDPEGRLPRICFLKVPEGKTAKNRLHVDVQVGGGRHLPNEERRPRVTAKVAELKAAGATVLVQEPAQLEDGLLNNAVMADPEGNEFCVI